MVIARRSRSGVRVLRIFFMDADATDSSSSEEEEEEEEEDAVLNCSFHRRRRGRVKRQVHEISFGNPVALRRKRQQPPPAETGSYQKRFRGVRQRPWGRFSAEIRASVALQKRLWLGTFDTAEEAASMYDLAAVKLKGDKAVTNFPTAKKEDLKAAAAAAHECGGGGEASPKSVIQYGEDELRFDDCVGYGDVDAFGFRVVEEMVCATESCFWMPENWEEEEIEFGEIEDFLVSEIGAV